MTDRPLDCQGTTGPVGKHDFVTNREKALEGAIRYLLKVGYNHGRTQFEDGQPYDDDFGHNFDLDTLRSPEKETIRQALQQKAVDVEKLKIAIRAHKPTVEDIIEHNKTRS